MTDDVSKNVTSENTVYANFSSYFVNFALLGVICYLIWKILVTSRNDPEKPVDTTPQLPAMKKRDFTLEELKEYDGVKGEGRILIAVNNDVFDVTRGKQYYGPTGPYAVFAGRDASRGLATFSLERNADQYDDLSDLQPHEMESVLEWHMQFKEKYQHVGRLLKPGETHNSYSEDEEETETSSGVPATAPTSTPAAAAPAPTAAPTPAAAAAESVKAKEE